MRDAVGAVLDERAEAPLALAQRFVGQRQLARALLDAHFELLLGLAQRLGGGGGVGDVARGGVHEAAGRLRAPRQHAIGAVLVAEPRLEILDALAAIDLRVHDLDGARAIVGMLHFHVVEGQRLFHGVAEHVRHRGAHALEMAVGARDGEQVDGQIEEAVELGLGARAAGEVAANGVERQRHEDEREHAAADDDRLRDLRAAAARRARAR